LYFDNSLISPGKQHAAFGRAQDPSSI